jgi:hypothetical protein
VTSTAADYGPLTTSASKSDVTDFRRRAKAAARNGGRVGGGTIVAIVFTSLVGGFILLFTLLVILAFAASGLADGASPWIALAIVAVLALVSGGIVVLARRSNHARWERRLRLSRFAVTNGLAYSPGDPAPGYTGSIFGVGGSRQVSDHMSSTRGRFFDYGTYSYMTSDGKNQHRHDWGFVAMRLDRRLPHMILDAKANNGMFASSLPTSVSRDQRMSLEGDFDRFFTLYCPREYERDALYVFTPDLMALLIDEVAAFDVEIVDDWLFLYSPGALALTEPAVHERIFRIISTVGAKTVSQTDRYVDDRVAATTVTSDQWPAPAAATVVGIDLPAPAPSPHSVAPSGRRLRTGSPTATLVVVLVVVALVTLLTSAGVVAFALAAFS